MEQKQTLPNATGVLILGICSILFSCFLIGLVLGIIGLALGSKAKKLYAANPEMYSGYGSLNAGYIMSIIGTIFGGLTILYYVVIGGTLLAVLGNM
jgi:hypothetical protein